MKTTVKIVGRDDGLVALKSLEPGDTFIHPAFADAHMVGDEPYGCQNIRASIRFNNGHLYAYDPDVRVKPTCCNITVTPQE